jgi:hypothetical protein
MPDITSELSPIAGDLIAGISASMNDREPSAACPPASDRVHPGGQRSERKCCLHFAFQTLEGEIFVGLVQRTASFKLNVSEWCNSSEFDLAPERLLRTFAKPD